MAVKDIFAFFEKNKKDSLLSSIGKGMVRPLTEGVRYIGEGGRFLGGALGNAISGSAGGDYTPLWKYGENYEPALYDKDKWGKLTGGVSGGKKIKQGEAVKSGFQKGMGLASYVPSMGGAYASLPSAIGRGALGGGLYAGSETEDLTSSKGFGDIAGGAAIGGAAGAAGYGLQKLSQNIIGKSAEKALEKSEKLTNKGWDKRMKGLGFKYSDFAKSKATGLEKFKSAWNQIDELGYPNSTRDEFVNSLDELSSTMKPVIQENAQKSTKTISKSIFDSVLKKYENRGVLDKLSKSSNVQNIVGEIGNKADDLTATDALNLKDLIKETLGGYKSLGKPSQNVEKQFITELFGTLDDAMESKIPEVSSELSKLSDLLAVRGGKAALKATEKLKIGVPAGALSQIPGLGYRPDITEIASKSMLGSAEKILSRAQNPTLGLIGKTAQGVSSTAPMIGQALGIGGQQALNQEPQGMEESTRKFQPTVSSLFQNTEYDPSVQQQTGGSLTGQVGQQDRVNLLTQLLNSGMSPSEAIAMSNFIMPEQEAETTKTASAKDANAATQGLSLLSELEGILASESGGNLEAQILGKGALGGVVGGGDYQKYLDTGERLADFYARLLTGAAINEQELEMYMNRFLPKWYESPDVKEQKIRHFREYFNGILNGTITPGTNTETTQDTGLGQ